MSRKINAVDLFAGCGGLADGFEQSGRFTTLAAVEWEKSPCENLSKRLRDKWSYKNSDKIVLRFDMRRTDELFEGWDDPEYGKSAGLVKTIGGESVDIIIGGPPCQAYSLAGRVRDSDGMRNDYRNYLFESYAKVVSRLKPRAFIFENVPGILSAEPDGTPIIVRISRRFSDLGYVILDDLSKAIVDFSEYGVPQKRKRVIILGVRKDVFGNKSSNVVTDFYTRALPSKKIDRVVTVRDAIGDLPKLMPLGETKKIDGKRFSHSLSYPPFSNHEPRWHSQRDIKVFRLLASDIESGRLEYSSPESLISLYAKVTGRQSNFFKYHVLRWDEPSTLIPAHLYKDGLRHIHPDPEQARTITVREAARLQGFPDDYVFVGNAADEYKMIGNAVPPVFSRKLAETISELLF